MQDRAEGRPHTEGDAVVEDEIVRQGETDRNHSRKCQQRAARAEDACPSAASEKRYAGEKEGEEGHARTDPIVGEDRDQQRGYGSDATYRGGQSVVHTVT